MDKQFGETPTDISEVAKIMGYKPLNEELDIDEKDEDEEDEAAEE